MWGVEVSDYQNCKATQGETPVIPGMSYGIFQGDLIPSCRSSDTLALLLKGELLEGFEVACMDDITDEDKCQRGPQGMPLPRFTPGVPFKTLAEWKAR